MAEGQGELDHALSLQGSNLVKVGYKSVLNLKSIAYFKAIDNISPNCLSERFYQLGFSPKHSLKALFLKSSHLSCVHTKGDFENH